MTPRTIRLEQAKMLKAIDGNGNPLVPEPQPDQPQILVQPNITFSPEINVPAPELPQVVVEPPSMEPVADAINQMHTAILDSIARIPAPQITVEPQPAPNMQPIADAMLLMTDAIQNKPDHSEAIKELLQKIADRPSTTQWSFSITRDNNGDIASVQAVKSNND